MKKKDEKRLAELQGEQIRLQAQCYLLEKALKTNEQQLDLITAAIGEHLDEGQSPAVPAEGKEDRADA